MTEQWRDVPGYIGTYQVSNLGRVKRVRGGSGAVSGRILSPSLQNGYPAVLLSNGGKRKSHYAHRLVAEAFIGPCPEGHLVHHRDEDQANAQLANLEYVLRGDHVHDHHILSCLRIEPGGPGHGITMFD